MVGRETAEGIQQENPEIMRTLGEKENHKFLKIEEADTIKQR